LGLSFALGTEPVAARSSLAEKQAPEVGTLDTVAGPQFCRGKIFVEPESLSVHSIALGERGEVYAEEGTPTKPVVAATGPERAGIVFANVPQTGMPGLSAVNQAPAGRLMSDRAGGILVATRGAIVDLNPGPSPISGDPAPGAAAQAAASGDGGDAAKARFLGIRSTAQDEDGNIYVGDENDSDGATVRIRFINRSAQAKTFYEGTPQQKIVPPDAIDTIAGADPTDDGDGRPALSTRLGGDLPAMTVAQDRLYVSSVSGNRGAGGPRIRLINLGSRAIAAHGVTVAPGAVETVAGGLPAGFSGDGGLARRAALSKVTGMAVSGEDLYLADQLNHRIRRIDAGGRITTVAGTGNTRPNAGGFNGNERRAVTAMLNRPFDVKAGTNARIYFSDERNGQVRFIDGGGLVHAALGRYINPSFSCSGPGPARKDREAAQMGIPRAVVADRFGNTYVSMPDLGQVKEITPSGDVNNVGAENKGCGPKGACPTAQAGVTPARPSALAARPQGGLYVLDGGVIRFVNLTRHTVRLHGVVVPAGQSRPVAGSGPASSGAGSSTKGKGPAANDGKALGAAPVAEGSLTADGHGNLFIAEYGHPEVKVLGPDGVLRAAVAYPPCCLEPAALAADQAGNLYIGDRLTAQVWLANRTSSPLNLHGQVIPPVSIRPVAGNGRRGAGGDGGPALQGQLDNPEALAVDPKSNLFIADSSDNTIRKVDASGAISTVAGTGKAGFNGDGLRSNLSALSTPSSLAVTACGDLMIVDRGNGRVRRLVVSGNCLTKARAAAKANPSQARNRSTGFEILGGFLILAGLGFSIGWVIRRT